MRTTISILFLVACSGGSKSTPVPAAEEAPAEAPKAVELSPEEVRAEFAESVQEVLNPEVDPCEDFYEYACGGWFASTELPGDRSRMTRAFSEIDDRNKDLLKTILDDAAAGVSEDPAWKKVGTFYGACLDEDAIDARGMEPVKPQLDLVAGVDSLESLSAVAGKLAGQGVGTLFSWSVWGDLKDPDTNILYMGQGGMSLPERDYYLDASDEKEALRAEFVAHATRLLQMGGFEGETAEHMAHDVLAFETKLAEASFPPAELRDPVATYNKIDRAGVQKQLGAFPLDAWFAAIGAPDATAISVEKPEYFASLGKLLSETDPEVLRSYLAYHVLSEAAAELGRDVQKENFGFYGVTLSGQKEQEPRWKRCASRIDDGMGDLLGQAYVERAFGGDSKPTAIDMISRVQAAFAAGLDDLAWMDDATRARAKEKAASFTNKIGYPDTWKSYDDLSLESGKHFENMTAAYGHWAKQELAKVGKPSDPTEWFMTASTVNAYYNPTENEIVFPAGIMQPPMFHRSFPTAANFGAMGMVMGHEISHGFDDSGRQFTADGKLEDWWEPAAAKGFEEKAQCVIDAYSSFEAKEGLNVNGELTLGENIADIGGARFAFRAYRKWVEENGAEEPVAGLSGEKLFFVNMAQNWCSLITDEALEMQVRTDPHSPARFRVNGTMRNTPEFHEVFECAEGSGMRPKDDEICVVW